MKKIEANTLEEAYAIAAEAFNCSVTDLDYEIVQHPTKGFLGLGAKKAIIVAACHRQNQTPPETEESLTPTPSSEAVDTDHATPYDDEPTRDDAVDRSDDAPRESTPSTIPESTPLAQGSEAEILNGFFDESSQKPAKSTPKQSSPAPTAQKDAHESHPAYSDDELGPIIESQLNDLIRSTCFDIDTVEVDVIDGTAYIFIDGEDAALLIGKEGYRYNALSYLLYNWLHNEYGLFIKLEIAQFLASQQEMIRNYLQPVVEHVRQEGWGRTRPLDGILVQIALEQLREEFPDKYVAIKRTRTGERYIIINAFNKRT